MKDDSSIFKRFRSFRSMAQLYQSSVPGPVVDTEGITPLLPVKAVRVCVFALRGSHEYSSDVPTASFQAKPSQCDVFF